MKPNVFGDVQFISGIGWVEKTNGVGNSSLSGESDVMMISGLGSQPTHQPDFQQQKSTVTIQDAKDAASR